MIEIRLYQSRQGSWRWQVRERCTERSKWTLLGDGTGYLTASEAAAAAEHLIELTRAGALG
jgi:hypothetical protein